MISLKNLNELLNQAKAASNLLRHPDMGDVVPGTAHVACMLYTAIVEAEAELRANDGLAWGNTEWIQKTEMWP